MVGCAKAAPTWTTIIAPSAMSAARPVCGADGEPVVAIALNASFCKINSRRGSFLPVFYSALKGINIHIVRPIVLLT
jgi:hypothetical protein